MAILLTMPLSVAVVSIESGITNPPSADRVAAEASGKTSCNELVLLNHVVPSSKMSSTISSFSNSTGITSETPRVALVPITNDRLSCT